MKSIKILSIFAAIFLFGYFFTPVDLAAQTNDSEQISWEDDDEDEADGDEEGPGNYAEVLVRLNGEEIELSEEVKVNRNDTLDIQVRHLKPGSFVAIHMEKGGIKLKKKGFYANSLGQLDLEVRTGRKKLSGKATLYYTPSNGRKKERKVSLSIE